MPQPPFANYQPQFTWLQATWAASVAAVGYLPNEPVKDVLKASPYHCVSVEWVGPSTELNVNIAFIDTGAAMWIGIEGTTNFSQALAFVMRDGFVFPWDDNRGVYKIFHEVATSCVLDIKSKVNQQKPLILTGHSLGGAAAVLAAQLLKLQGYDVRGVYTFGQPFTGNQAWANTYPLPDDSVFNHLDCVPKFPQYGSVGETLEDFWIWLNEPVFEPPHPTTAHLGMPRELDAPGAADDKTLLWDRLKLLCTRLTIDQIFEHLMGEYVGLCFENLGPQGKQLFLPLALELQKTNSIKLLNSAFPAADPDAFITPAAQIANEERAYARTLLGPQSKARIRLFRSPYVPPIPGQTYTPNEASFAGYAPIIPDANAPISGGGYSSCRIGPKRFTFRAAGEQGPPQLIAGVFTSYVFADGSEKAVHVKPFASPIEVSQAGQEITVELSAIVTRVSD